MSPQDRILEILQEALRVAVEGMLLEVLEREVARALGRPISRKSLEGLLVRNPERFEVDAGGRWRLRVRVEEIEPEDSGLPPGRQLLERGRFVVFDLETLGREAAGEETEIIEIALARYEDGQRVETWQTFVRPEAAIPPFITELTTICDEDVADAPSQKEALEEFFARVHGLPVIAHNGLAFDGAVLHNVAKRVGVPVPPDFLLLDTLPLARLFHQSPGQRHTNEELAQHYGCHRPGAHRADVDVEMLGGVGRRIAQRVKPASPGRDILRAPAQGRGALGRPP
jgi:DNA polymerase III epsilon subunit-like protein